MLGNGLADAAAKVALTMHPMSQQLVDRIEQRRSVVKMAARYLARSTAQALDDAEDYPKMHPTKGSNQLARQQCVGRVQAALLL